MKTVLTRLKYSLLVSMAALEKRMNHGCLPCVIVCWSSQSGELEVCGSCAEVEGIPVSSPASWVPGVFAVGSDDVVRVAAGGDAFEGADIWERVEVRS